MFLIPLLLQAASAMPPVAGAQPNWGASISELVTESGGTITEIAPTASRFNGLQLRAKSETKQFSVWYLFAPMSERLGAVDIFPKDSGTCLDWLSELRVSLGEPYYSGQQGGSVVADWQDADTTAEYTIAGRSKKRMVCHLMLRSASPLSSEWVQ
jgi:hypothetical protein